MEITKMVEMLSNAISIKKINDKTFQIVSKAEFEDETAIEVYLMEDANGKKILTDKKKTFQYMDEIYDLKSDDVKSSIDSILNIYGYTKYQDAIVCKLKEDDDICEKYFQFITCIGQLANMFVFFNKPEEDDE